MLEEEEGKEEEEEESTSQLLHRTSVYDRAILTMASSAYEGLRILQGNFLYANTILAILNGTYHRPALP